MYVILQVLQNFKLLYEHFTLPLNQYKHTDRYILCWFPKCTGLTQVLKRKLNFQSSGTARMLDLAQTVFNYGTGPRVYRVPFQRQFL